MYVCASSIGFFTNMLCILIFIELKLNYLNLNFWVNQIKGTLHHDCLLMMTAVTWWEHGDMYCILLNNKIELSMPEERKITKDSKRLWESQ